MRGSYPHWVCENLDQRMPYPHYSDPTWDEYQLIYGAPGTLKVKRVESKAPRFRDQYDAFDMHFTRTYTVDRLVCEPDHTDGSADSDRLWQWDYDKAQVAWAAVPESERNTPRGVQTYLSAYWNRSVRLISIHAITNRATGYAVYSYAWAWEVPR